MGCWFWPWEMIGLVFSIEVGCSKTMGRITEGGLWSSGSLERELEI